MKGFLDEWGLVLGACLMVCISAISAYFKELEKATVEWPKRKHFTVLCCKFTYSGFSGMLVWYGAQSIIQFGYKVPEPIIPFLIGVAGFSGAQFIDFIGVTLLDYGRKKLGLEPKEQPKG